MEPDDRLHEYRTHLLDALRARLGTWTEMPGSVQIFLDYECVGTLDCTQGASTFVSTGSARSVGHLEIRREDGSLLGALTPPDLGVRTSTFPVGGHTLEVTVRNHGDLGSVTVMFKPAQTLWQRAHDVAARATGASLGVPSTDGTWARNLVLSQVALAAIVLALGADRLTGWIAHLTPSGQEGPKAAVAEETIPRIDRRLEQLVQIQESVARAARSQQEEIARLHRALAAVTAAQDRLTSGVQTVRRDVSRREMTAGRAVNDLARRLLSQTETERERIREELRLLAAANQTLARQVSDLKTSHDALAKQLRSATVDVSRARPPQQKDEPAGERPNEAGSTQIAEARSTPTEALTFWVSFQEGTSEESIEHLITAIHGRRGSLDGGWYPIEVALPPSEPADRFLDTLRQAKIVKALRTGLGSGPPQ
jgi:hypothetical protein